MRVDACLRGREFGGASDVFVMIRLGFTDLRLCGFAGLRVEDFESLRV